MSLYMTIGEVAKQGGLRASAIRYYEKSGLLPKPIRSGGQRRYDSTILQRLAVLERAKDCGFTLEEVRALFNGFRSDVPLSKRWQDLASRKIAELEALTERIAVMRVCSNVPNGAAASTSGVRAENTGRRGEALEAVAANPTQASLH